ncbi:hypothetical protein KSP40_PGU009595 [Platanthera guangdongensis]|uniref:Uncharacterized protein n=1 Tax=Platanthera guangdongensis TaxID=2320717 RepID=A0ABR2MH83_9ASPA
MKEMLRCCISCILPFGSLDVIHIVHASGYVDEISHAVCAGDIMKEHPNHVLRISISPVSKPAIAAARRVAVLQPTSELQRGKIYFLVPASEEKEAPPPRRRRTAWGTKREQSRGVDGYVGEILKGCVVVPERERRRGRVGVWRPFLESISEANAAADL